MKRLVKLLLGLVLTVVILIAAGGAILGAFVDPNDYKPEIEQLALEQGGIELKINGQIGWSVFPWLGLELNEISAQYPEQPKLADLKQAQVSIRLPALLSGQVQMQSIVVDGLVLNLTQHKDGSNNWSLADKGKTAEPATETADSSTSAPPLQLDINSIKIINGQLSFTDKTTGNRAELTDLNITSGKVVINQAFPVEIGFNARQFSADSDSAAAQVTAKLTTNLTLDIENQKVQLANLASSLGLKAAGLPEQGLTLNLNADIAADLPAQKASLDNLLITLAGLKTSGAINVSNFAKPQLSGQLDIASFNLKELLKTLGQPAIETQDPKALTALALSLTLGGKPGILAAEQLTIKLDDTTFNGSAGFNMGNGAINLALKGDQLNADRYMPPAAEAPAQPAAATDTKQPRYSKEPVIPVEPLRALELDANFKLTKLHVQKMDVSNIELNVNAHKGLVKVDKINADLFGGTIRNSVTLDTRAKTVKMRTIKNISNIQIGDMLKTTANVDALTGSFSSQSDTTSRGRSVYDIVHSLNGTASIQMKDGEIKGIDMAQTICQGMNTVGSLGIDTQQVDRSTPFANITASTKIRNGVVSNQDLKASLDAIDLKGKGTVNLPQEALDYRLALVINDNLFKKTCRIPGKLENVEWPVDCKGGFDTPPVELCKPDLSVFENILKAKAQEKLDKAKDKVEDKLKEKLQDKLKGLFGS